MSATPLPEALAEAEPGVGDDAILQTAPVAPSADIRHIVRSIRRRTLHVEWLGERAFQRLGADWNHLLAKSCSDTLFLTWEWQESWWRHFGSQLGGRLRVMTARDATGRLLGIAPLFERTEHVRGIPIRALRLIGDGSGDGDDLDLIVRKGHLSRVTCAFLRELDRRSDWDVLRLRPVPETSPTLRAIRRAAAVVGWLERCDKLGCTESPLPGSWEEFLGRLPARFRSRVRSILRRNQEDTRAERITNPAELAAGLEGLFDLHGQRWRASGQAGSFACPQRRAFFRDFAGRALNRGWLRFYALRGKDRTLALQIGYVYQGVFLQIQEAFDPDRALASPGVALRARVIQDCIEEGIHNYDNLLGTPHHKMRWGGRARWVCDVAIARRRPRGFIAVRLPVLLAGVSQLLRRSAAQLKSCWPWAWGGSRSAQAAVTPPTRHEVRR